MKEIWKDIKGYEGFYQVSNIGNVKSLDRKYSNYKGRLLKQSIIGNGYLGIGMCANGKKKYCSVHRLVAIHFIPNPENKRTVNHKWGNKLDNRACALEWATFSENRYHAHRTGLYKVGKGKDNHLSKPVIQYSIDNKEIERYESQTEASSITGIYRKSISSACVGRYKTAGGFMWSFA